MAKPPPMCMQDLDAMPICGNPHCGHDHSNETVTYLKPMCHPGAGLRVSYDRDTGMLTCSCKRCEKYVVDIPVAARIEL